MKRIIIIGLVLLFVTSLYAQGQKKNYTISGFVKENGSGELLIGVNIYIKGTQIGTVTNNYGFYSLTIPKQDLNLTYSYVGYMMQLKHIKLNNDTVLNVNLGANLELSEVEIKAYRDRISDKAEMSVVKVPIQQMKEIPALMGERDVFKVLQLLPGIRSGSEASAGLYVRGGGPDQNLILLDDATVYNAMHLFGFFSVFNGDAIKSVELTKGGFPAENGGRLSSVVDIRLKDGNKEKIGGEGSIGLLSSRLLLEGPIVKGKSSFIISGRRTYIDVLARPFMSKETDEVTGYYFYDLNAKVNYEISDRDKIYLSGYFGRDKFYSESSSDKYSSSNDLYWENITGTLRWNHLFTNKLFSNTSLIFSNYNFAVNSEEINGGDKFELKYNSGIRDISLKEDLHWMPRVNHYVKMGFQITNHRFTPSAVVLTGSSFETDYNVKTLNSFETAAYIQDEWKINALTKVNIGLRFSNFNFEDTHYFGLEPRLLISRMLSESFSIKASYTIMNQYIHLLTQSGIGLPTDLWVPATDRVGPQKSQQVAIGVAKDFDKQAFSISVEAYYKTMNNIIAYKEGSNFMMIDDPFSNKEFHYEDNVTSGKGYSTGVEFLLQRKFGRLSGWIGYTLSYTRHQFDELNYGKEFFPRHDRRHDISIVAIYKLSKRFTFSSTWVYGTGDALTLGQSNYIAYSHNPTGPTGAQNNFYPRQVTYYGDKNSFRMEAYHRLDIGIQFHRKLKWGGESIIDVSVYNVYNHKNPFYYDVRYDPKSQENKLVQYSLIPVLPSVSYYLKF
ncbi:MAG: TonB-dependent receptor [Bacteroidales bacterium]|nr:TonB-dependent receptor [Bacteroidales bacterium]